LLGVLSNFEGSPAVFSLQQSYYLAGLFVLLFGDWVDYNVLIIGVIDKGKKMPMELAKCVYLLKSLIDIV
jgi:hypothetical protein